MDIQADIRGFIHDNFHFREKAGELVATESLMEAGIIDSAGVLTLVLFLEEKFLIKVADDEVTPDNLDSVAKLTAYVEGKLRTSAEGD